MKFRQYYLNVLARNYLRFFFTGAEVAAEFGYWNAAGVLQIHAAIALADAMSIKLGGVRCRGEDHHETINLLDELVAPTELKKKALSQLRTIIDHKNLVAYRGQVFTRRDVDRLVKLLERFHAWALSIVDN